MGSRNRFDGKRVIVCGGSRGIGLETAREFVLRGASVCIVARDAADLAVAAQSLAASVTEAGQRIDTLACDTTDAERLQPLFNAHIAQHGVPDYLINNVGYAYPQYLLKLKLQDFRDNMEVNYYGQLVPTLALLPRFMAAGKGHIAYVSSMLGYLGIMGYATYAPTKYAIVGLSDALRNELRPYNIGVSVLYPPDTETAGFEKENLSKPEETRLMSRNVKPMSAQAVAKVFVDGIARRRYTIMPGQAGMVWRLNRYFPGLVRWLLDREYAKARAAIKSAAARPER